MFLLQNDICLVIIYLFIIFNKSSGILSRYIPTNSGWYLLFYCLGRTLNLLVRKCFKRYRHSLARGSLGVKEGVHLCKSRTLMQAYGLNGKREKSMVNVSITNGEVRLPKGKGKLEVAKSKKGTLYTRFYVRVKEYDSEYEDNIHYECYSCIAYNDVAEKIAKMNAKSGSNISLVAKMTLSKDVMAAKEDATDKAHTRYVQGLELKLLDIEYVPMRSSKKQGTESQAKISGNTPSNVEDTASNEANANTSSVPTTATTTVPTRTAETGSIDFFMKEALNEISI